MTKYIIYKITNLINSKIYIGKTSKTLEKRWEGHKNSINAKKLQHLKLVRAFRKYGFENFKIEVIDYALSEEDMMNKENRYIIEHNSLSDNIGYNMIIQTHVNQILNEKSLKTKCKNIYKQKSLQKLGEYGIGVAKDRNTFKALMFINKKRYILRFDNANDAMIAHDKLAIYFHKENAILNFPDKKYTEDEILNNYKLFEDHFNRKYSSFYIGVTKRKGKFEAGINKDKKHYYLGMYKTEKEAAEVYDIKAKELFGEKAKLNFS